MSYPPNFRSRYDPRLERQPRWPQNSSHGRGHHRAGPSTSNFHESRNAKNKPFTIIKPNESQSFSIIKPNESRPFTVVKPNESRPFTVVKPNESRPFTVVKPNESRPFTVVKPNESRPFTVVKPNEPRPFTVVKPNEPRPFTVVKPNESRQSQDKPFSILTPHNNFNDFMSPAQSLRGRNIYTKLSLKHSNYFIFGSKATSDVLKMCYLYAVARLIYEREQDETIIPALAAAEFAADYLPDNRRLFGCEADAYFKAVMGKAVRDPSFISKVRPKPDLFATLEEFGLPPVYPTPKPEPLSGEQYMRILQILSTSLDPAYTSCDLVVTLTAIAPCLQLDNITPTFLRRLQNTVSSELNKNIRLDIRSANIFFDQYLKEASESEVEEMMVCWRLTIPESAIRLKALLKRMPGNGLLPITLLGRALTECEDFPWEKTLKLYPEEWKAAHKAIKEINNDAFYGYRRNKNDVVHPRHYENLAWLGRQLCIEKLHDDYPNLHLWIEEPKHAAEVKRLIDTYVANLGRGSAMECET